MDIVRETGSAKLMTASGAIVPATGGATCGFLCTTAGTIQLDSGIAAGVNVVPSFAVVVGTWYPLPFAWPTGCYATLGGGAQGTFGVFQ